MSVLSVSTSLFLVFHIHVSILTDSLAERYLRSFQHDLNFISGGKLARCNLKMLVAHTIEERLAVLTVIDRTQCNILRCHSCKSLRYFILISFILHTVSHICIRYGIVGLCI